MTERGEEEDTHSLSIFGQFQTVIKSELIRISLRGKQLPPPIVDIYSEACGTKQRAECKSRIGLGKMVGNG